MAIRSVLTWPDDRLRVVAHDVKVVDQGVRSLVVDLFDTMYDEGGVGLAATQIGDDRRVVVVDCGGEERDPKALINGRIVEREGTVIWREACLSVPGVSAEVERSASIVVAYLDLDGSEVELEASGLLSVCIQHELDHLDGQIYIDRLGTLERKATLLDYEDAKQAVEGSERS